MNRFVQVLGKTRQWISYVVMQRYFFVSWNKYWKGIYIHLPKVTHRVYFDSKWCLKKDKYSNVGARISQKLGV